MSVRLKQSGERTRYNGFWLNDSDRERMIAHWINNTPSAGAIIKELIFRYITVSNYATDVGQIYEPEEPGRTTEAFLDFED